MRTDKGADEARDRAAGFGSRLRKALGAFDLARNFEKAVDQRFAALASLDQSVKERARRLEWMNQGIVEGEARADDVVRVFRSFEQRLTDLRDQERALRAVETTVVAFEDRGWSVTTRLDRDVAAGEAREAAVADAVQQLERRAIDTLDGFETRVSDCEARTRIAEQTITHLSDVSSRTLPELQTRLQEAEDQNQSTRRLVAEGERVAMSLTALEQRLPAVGRCNENLARIELAVPQIERRLEDLNASVAAQSRALAVHQQLVRHTLEESEKTAAVVSGLEGRMADLSCSHQQLDRLGECLEQLERRAAAAVGALAQAAHAKHDLEREIAVLQTLLRSTAETVDDEAAKLDGLQERTDRYREERAESTRAIVSGLEAQLDRFQPQLEQLEARLAVASTAIEKSTGAGNDLDEHVRQLEQRAAAATAAVGRVNRSTSPSARPPLITLRFRRRRPRTWRPRSPARLMVGGLALALSAVIVLLAGRVWRSNPVEDKTHVPARPVPVLPSRAIMLAPARAVPPLTPRTVGIRDDRPEAARPAPAVSAAPVAPIVASEPSVPTSAGQTPQFVGTLLIESEPAGAAAFVNEASIGDTPVLLKDVRAGSYVVRVEYEGYVRWSTAATVSAIREARVKAKLERDGSR